MTFNIPNTKTRHKTKTEKHGEISLEQLNELKRCASDLSYFAKYLKLDKKGSPISWRDYQLREFDVLQTYNNVIHNWCRHAGNRWIEAAYVLWYVTFHSAQLCALFDVKHIMAKEQLALIKMMYMNLPWWLKKDADFHKTYATFGTDLNRSYIVVGVYGSGLCRGRTINLLVCRNFAFVKEAIATDFIASMFPVMLSGRPGLNRILISSCPNGKGNLFHHLWENCTHLPTVYPPEPTVFVGTEVTYSTHVKPYMNNDMSSMLPHHIYLAEYECKFVDR